jgi:hypothetical protein
MAVKNPMQPIVNDGGVLRFKSNNIVRFLLDRGPNDLNTLGNIRYLFSQDDWDQFMQLIGYSVSGYGDLSTVSRESVEAADGATPQG